MTTLARRLLKNIRTQIKYRLLRNNDKSIKLIGFPDIDNVSILESDIVIFDRACIANSVLGNKTKVFKNAIVRDSKIGPLCSIGDSVHIINKSDLLGTNVIRKDSYISNSILGEKSEVFENTTIDNSKIGPLCSIGNSVHIINKSDLLGTNVIRKGSYISNSILGKKSEVFENTTIDNSKIGPLCAIESNAKIVEKSSLSQNIVIHSGVSVSNSVIDNFSYISKNSSIVNATIGKFCSIGRDILIGIGNHPAKGFISTYPAFYSESNSGCRCSFVSNQLFDEFHPVSIGSDVWIGSRSIIIGGVKIGSGAIIAAGSIVSKDVAPYSIVAGVPAKKIRNRYDDPIINKLLNFSWWDKDIEWIIHHAPLFSNEDGFLSLIYDNMLPSQTSQP